MYVGIVRLERANCQVNTMTIRWMYHLVEAPHDITSLIHGQFNKDKQKRHVIVKDVSSAIQYLITER